MILQQSSLEKSDILALGLASELLWLHVLQHVQKVCRLLMAPLAGVEIACSGFDLTDILGPFKYSLEGLRGGPMYQARRINRATFGSHSAIDGDPEELWHATFVAHDPTATGIPVTVARCMAEELASRCSVPRRSDSDTFTTKEFVLCRPGTVSNGKRGYVDHPGAPFTC